MRTLLGTCAAALSYPLVLCVGLGMAATHLAGDVVPFGHDPEASLPIEQRDSDPLIFRTAA